jgi:hypothetical protein
MSDLENNEVEETPIEEVPFEETPEEEWDDDDDDLLNDLEDDDSFELPSGSFITIQVSTGQPIHHFTEEPMPARQLVLEKGLRFNGSYSMWFNGVAAEDNTVIPVGGTLAIIGEVKGG